MGVIMIGDSTTAHFSLPLSGPGVLDEYPALIDSELDKPPCSWGCAHCTDVLFCIIFFVPCPHTTMAIVAVFVLTLSLCPRLGRTEQDGILRQPAGLLQPRPAGQRQLDLQVHA